jgi:hypothetical protein
LFEVRTFLPGTEQWAMQRQTFLARSIGQTAVVLSAVLAVVPRLEAAAPRADKTSIKPEPAADAPRLVQEALDAELAGDAAGRDALLAQALKADPEFAPARWQSGQTKFQGQWRTPAEVQQFVSVHPDWAEYRRLRDSLGANVGAHIELARWCRDKKLAHEERFHWAMVVLAQPGHSEARERLSLIEYRGALFTREQAAALEQASKDADANSRRYQPHFAKLCRDAVSADAGARAKALSDLRGVRDPAALPALDQAVAKAMGKSPRFARELHLAFVAALASMPQHDATLGLLNHAVYAEDEAVRKAAAEGLKSRPQTDYVPLLMAALRTPIDVEVDVLTTPDGSVRLSETIVQSGPGADVTHTRSTGYLAEGALGHDPSRSNPAAVLDRHLARAADLAADTQSRADAANAEAAMLNERIAEVLRLAVEADLDDAPEAWWTQWTSYNELQSLAEEPAVSTHESRNFVYFYPQAPVRYYQPASKRANFAPRPEPWAPRTITSIMSREMAAQKGGAVTINLTPWRSCFIPGTPVWTQAGPVPIEEIVLGDMVLAQSPWTGEIAYRPVLNVTLGEPAPVLNLQIGEDTIGSTRGHRFWVLGRGWQMAKFLDGGTPLHALGGAVEVESVAKADAQVACYNLVVDEFHTFFVGRRQVLVHDFTCPQPVLAGLPGSATPRLSAAAATLAQ